MLYLCVSYIFPVIIIIIVPAVVVVAVAAAVVVLIIVTFIRRKKSKLELQHGIHDFSYVLVFMKLLW